MCIVTREYISVICIVSIISNFKKSNNELLSLLEGRIVN